MEVHGGGRTAVGALCSARATDSETAHARAREREKETETDGETETERHVVREEVHRDRPRGTRASEQRGFQWPSAGRCGDVHADVRRSQHGRVILDAAGGHGGVLPRPER